MTRYLVEMAVAPQTFDALIKNPHDRLQATRPAVEALGGTAEAYYFVVGQHIIYCVIQLPDEVALEALTMAVFAGGAVTSFNAKPILTSAEAVEAMEKARDTLYKPPSA